jgi:hypothetical protein
MSDLAALGQRLVGRWTTEATHPYLPGADIRGTCEVEWLPGERFLVHRTTFDHPDIPDALWVMGAEEMHYFDSRGVQRVYGLTLTRAGWELAMDKDAGAGSFAGAPFSQRMTYAFAGDDMVEGRGRLSHDGVTWEDDLAVTYRRA